MKIPIRMGAIPLKELSSLLGGEIPEALGNYIPHRLVTDSREVEKGDLFCALKGMDDGHRYIGEAAFRGAVAVLAERKTAASIPHITVPSVRKALGNWAAAVAVGATPFRIGVTGSVGKTTVKDALFTMLSPHIPTHATYQNYNNDLGLPFTVLSAPKETKALVCELGVSKRGEMAPLSAILRPHLSIITCIGHAHIGAFGSREAIAAEKTDILKSAAENGFLLVPAGETLLSFLPPHGIRRLAVSPFGPDASRAVGIPSVEGDAPRGFSLAYAAAVGEIMGLSKDEIADGVRRIFASVTRRKEETVGGIRLIDDGYNASPESMLSALSYLQSQAKSGRVAVLGDMLELGEKSAEYHRAIGRFAAANADLLFFFGAYAKEYERGARAYGARSEKEGGAFPRYLLLYGDPATMAKTIAARLSSSDTVLFKASRAERVERVIEEIKKHIG